MRKLNMGPGKRVGYADGITILNAVAGYLAITFIIDGRFLETALLIMAALCLDGLDGFVARRYGSTGGGHYLDSFADTISFCIAPALMLYKIYYDPMRGTAWVVPENTLAVAASTLVAAFGILRLARFVEADHEKGEFRGLPTPANAVLLTSMAYLFGPTQAVPVLLFSVLTSFLMISNVPYPKISDATRGPLILVIAFIGTASLAFLFLAASPTGIVKILFSIALAVTLGYLIGGPLYAGKPRPRGKVLRVQRE